MNQLIAIIVTALVLFISGVVVLTVFFRATWAKREKESLTALDLTALEESAMLLVGQLREESDRIAADLDRRKEELQALIAEANKVSQVINRSLDPSEIARTTGIDRAAVGLAMNLEKLGIK